ncbi:prolipoprotein diacylglyceryl transferase, partial [Citrobacter sp. AAK_AS5]
LLWTLKHQRNWLDTTDFIAPLVPLGLMAGRIGNFINGELWGRVADATLPWAMAFPQVDSQPRHPSQLYHAGLEGLTLFLVLWLYSRQPRP